MSVVTVRKNERSWAIDMISDINIMLSRLNLTIKRVGGENTISVDRSTHMFPDVLLYGDDDQSRILQGWELKLPDTLITDSSLISDATRKALSLSLNSFVVWNFTTGVFYKMNDLGAFVPEKTWNVPCVIRTREDVSRTKQQWLPVVEEIILTVNEYLVNGNLRIGSVGQFLSENLLLEIIYRNKQELARHLENEAIRDGIMRSTLSVWWEGVKAEYVADENSVYSAYAKVLLLHWVNRIVFAHVIDSYYDVAKSVRNITADTTPQVADSIFKQITDTCDFFNVFAECKYNTCLDIASWSDLVEANLFLNSTYGASIKLSDLQAVLENTVIVAKREIRGQFTTPAPLAELLAKITVSDWTKPVIDPCCGTGSIAKAVLNEKTRLINGKEAYTTTWASDKFSFPLQIANISLVDARSMNYPCRLFCSNVFEIGTNNSVSIVDPTDGKRIELLTPAFSAVVSNLPFVRFENIDTDELSYLNQICKAYEEKHGEELNRKSDLYAYILYHIEKILDDDGRVGVIVSNSWLGTEWGEQFFKAITEKYRIDNIIISGSGRWFSSADVVANILLLAKKRGGTGTRPVTFSIIRKSLDALSQDPEMMDTAINSIVLHREIDPTVVV